MATEPHQVGWLRNEPGELLDAAAVRAEVNSPTYLAGRYDERDLALINPARLAWGLARAAEEAGIRILEQTPVLGIGRNGTRLALATPHATITARKAALGTNAFRSLVRRIRLHTVPVYDHALVTEPLSPGSSGSVGWRNRQGVSDLTNQFHYYRMTADNRILWGGYDAIYHYGRHIRTRYDQRPADHADPRRALLPDVPAARRPALHPPVGRRDRHQHAVLRVLRHRAPRRRGLRAGYTGLGVGATRFGAQVMLDLLDGEPTADQPAHGPAARFRSRRSRGLRGHRANRAVAGAGRRPARAAQPAAAHAGPDRGGLRLLT